jgi:hypothetical protein
MPECPDCHRLKCRVDLAAWLAVGAAAYFLRLADDYPECSPAIVVTRRAKSTLEEYELEYEAHMAGHAHRTRLPMVS